VIVRAGVTVKTDVEEREPMDTQVLRTSTDTAELCSAIVAGGHEVDIELLIDAWKRIARNAAASSPYELASWRVGHGPVPAHGERGVRQPLWPAGGYFVVQRFDIYEPVDLMARDLPRRGKSGVLAVWRGHQFSLNKQPHTRAVGATAAKTKKMWAIEPATSVRNISRCYPADRAQVIVDAAAAIASSATGERAPTSATPPA
jgi:hypothetical protein